MENISTALVINFRYAPFVVEDGKSKPLVALSEAEGWLFTEEGEDATKSVYVLTKPKLKLPVILIPGGSETGAPKSQTPQPDRLTRM